MATATRHLKPSTDWRQWSVSAKMQLLERLQSRRLGMFAADALPVEVQPAAVKWPSVFINAETGREYKPHHEDEAAFVNDDSPRYALAKGGEGGGKSVAGIIKNLQRLKRGMTGIMVSPDFEHFCRSLWPEFRRWCPREAVIESHRYRLDQTWSPQRPFALHFYSETGNLATLYCGGIDDPSSWEGPNVNFAHIDEARRRKEPDALKVLDGRVRIPGPNKEAPQLWLTTTPRKHWLFDYFGPEHENDPLANFKRNARVITLLTSDNERAGNLSEGFTVQRGMSLTETERRVLLEAEWEDIDEAGRFLPSVALWDACRQDVPVLDAHTPVILAMDAGESNDTFGTLLISRHWEQESLLAIRYVRAYVPTKGIALNFDEIESDIRDLCSRYAVQQVAYDPFLLGQMMRRLTRSDNPIPVPCEPFPQGAQRLESDKLLLDLIMQRRIVHDGDADLRNHVNNADRKNDTESRKLRIVKRTQSLKIDLAVCLSMAASRAFDLLFTPQTPAVLALGSTRGWSAQT